jgi:diguanylate cyclase (GGDEF)-like protein
MIGLPEIHAIRAFSAIVERRTKTPADTNPAGAFLVVQAGHLQEINSSYGQNAGDEALALIAMAIRMSVRDSDVLGRLGETMFGLFLPGADEAEARRVAGRIAANVSDVYFAPAKATSAVSARVGGIVLAEHLGFDDMFRQAEEYLFTGEIQDTSEMTIALGAARMPGAVRH